MIYHFLAEDTYSGTNELVIIKELGIVFFDENYPKLPYGAKQLIKNVWFAI